ncbi:chaplin [Streptomyces sp. 8N706]|uniref:chaplin n=1 Tax=Streptomyces sp. 8N706 TaxID=3457416 RepID=UPI003FD3F64C
MKAIKSIAVVGLAAGMLAAGAGAATAHDGGKVKGHDEKSRHASHDGHKAKPESKDKAKPESKDKGKPESKDKGKPESKDKGKHESKDKGKHESKHESKHKGKHDSTYKAKHKAKHKAKKDHVTYYVTKKDKAEEVVKGYAVGSPGFGSGNVTQAVTPVQTNACGTTANAGAGFLNPAFGGVCVNR